ncbi:hypothetical protein TrVE_jg8067 [Triparma verrucosa]|uniref:Uncharacterized protein n=1 Tax=Triparma verrucosa TaxID=1606542 RepID=A0A9W7BLP4_9STRA|nr:hypothetical protein TrVE_jg8067 [Triparma verrucosa]
MAPKKRSAFVAREPLPPPFAQPTALPLTRTAQGTLVSIPLGQLTTSVINNSLSQYHKVLTSQPLTTFNLSHPTNHPSTTSSCTLPTHYGCDKVMKDIEEVCGELWTSRTKSYDINSSLTSSSIASSIKKNEPTIIIPKDDVQREVRRRVREVASEVDEESIAKVFIHDEGLQFTASKSNWSITGTAGRSSSPNLTTCHCTSVTFKSSLDVLPHLYQRCKILCSKFGLRVACEFMNDLEVYTNVVEASIELRRLKVKWKLTHVVEDIREEEEAVIAEFGVWKEKVEIQGRRDGVHVLVSGNDISYKWDSDAENLIWTVKAHLVSRVLKFVDERVQSEGLQVNEIGGEFEVLVVVNVKGFKVDLIVGYGRVDRNNGRVFSEMSNMDKVCNTVNDFMRKHGGEEGKEGEAGGKEEEIENVRRAAFAVAADLVKGVVGEGREVVIGKEEVEVKGGGGGKRRKGEGGRMSVKEFAAMFSDNE